MVGAEVSRTVENQMTKTVDSYMKTRFCSGAYLGIVVY